MIFKYHRHKPNANIIFAQTKGYDFARQKTEGIINSLNEGSFIVLPSQ